MPPVNAEMELAVSLLYGSVEIYVKEGDQYVGWSFGFLRC